MKLVWMYVGLNYTVIHRREGVFYLYRIPKVTQYWRLLLEYINRIQLLEEHGPLRIARVHEYRGPGVPKGLRFLNFSLRL